MDKKKAKELRTKLSNKLIKLVAPVGMSIDEYKIQCNLNGFNASIENGMFLHWIIVAQDDDSTCVEDQVHDAIINALEKKYLLDTSSAEQCSYFCDAIRDMVPQDKDYTIKLLEAVLKNYKDSDGYGADVFDFCKRLNKCLGFTSVEYFNYDGLKDVVTKMVRNQVG